MNQTYVNGTQCFIPFGGFIFLTFTTPQTMIISKAFSNYVNGTHQTIPLSRILLNVPTTPQTMIASRAFINKQDKEQTKQQNYRRFQSILWNMVELL